MTLSVVKQALFVLAGALVVLVVVLPFAARATNTALIERDGEPVTIVLNGRTMVDQGEVADDVLVANGQATVRGRVEGSVVVLNGSAFVSGSVGGDVLVVRGGAWIGSAAVVRGDVITSTPARVSEQAVVNGAIEQAGPVEGIRSLLERLGPSLWVGLALALLVLGAGAGRLAGDRLDAAGRHLTRRPLRSAGVGIALLAGLTLLALVAAASLLGGLLGLLLLALTALLAVAGLVVGAAALGHGLLPKRSPVARVVVGVVAAVALLRLGALVPMVGGLLTALAAAAGAGALVLSRRPDEPEVDADGINLDLRPGHEPVATVLARAETERRTSTGDPEPAVTVGADPAPISGPRIIAALPVRAEPYPEDPTGSGGNGARRLR